MISYDPKVGIVKVPLTEEAFGKRTGDAHRNTLYEEGPWFYHRDSLYYMVNAAGGIPEFIAYSTSLSPTGPWTYRGIILPTRDGPTPIGHLNPYETTRAATIAWEVGVQTKTSSTADVYVTDIHDGGYIKVRSVDLGSRGAKGLAACVANAAAGSSIEVHLDSKDGPLAGTVAVAGTGGPDWWKVQTTPVSGAKGIHDLFFIFKGTPAAAPFDFQWWKFSN